MSQLDVCVNCGSQDFEEEDGQLVCTQCGQQKEGLLQVADDSGDFGTQGKVSRKKIEKKKVRYTRVYRGTKAYRLYLQAWQHILWKQAFALIHELKVAPPELWTVARDLWMLRLSQLTARLDRDDPSTASQDVRADTASEERLPINGQVQDSEASAATTSFAPSLWASISHIYVSMLILRLPISLAKLHHLILTDQIPFLRAIRHIPYEMVSRLPPEYHGVLDTLSIPTKTDLQEAIGNLISIFQNDFHLAVPALNWKILLFEWIQKLALPIEVYPVFKRLVSLLGFTLTYNSRLEESSTGDKNQKIKSRKTPVFWPEVQLISVLVVATKLLFPFPLPTTMPQADFSNTKTPVSDPTSISLSWFTWLSLHRADPTSNSRSKSSSQQSPFPTGKEIEVRDVDIREMSDEAIDAYMDWYQRTFTTPDAILATKKTELEQSILNMFPVRTIPNTSSFNDNNVTRKEQKEEQDEERTLAERVQAEAVFPGSVNVNTPVSGSVPESAERRRLPYPVFPTVDSVEATTSFYNNEAEENPVLYFHQLAADVACVDLKRLVLAVRHTEQRLEKWWREKKRTEVFVDADDVDVENENDIVMD